MALGAAARRRRADRRAARRRPPAGQPRYGTFGIDLAARDTGVKPGDDFNRYANGTWLRTTEIPADRTSWSLWTALSEDIEQQLRAIVTEAAASSDPAQRRVGDFYAAWMDEAGIEARGTAPLRPYLERIDAIRNRDDLIAVFATPGYTAPVGIGIIPDFADPTRYTAIAGQGGLGMPNRDYYLREGAQYDRYRTAYRAYIVQLHRLAGLSRSRSQGRSHHRAGTAHRRGALGARAQPRHPGDQQSDEPRAARPRSRRSSSGTTICRRRGLGAANSVIATQTTAITAIGRLLDRCRSTPGRNISPSTSSTATRSSCRAPSTRRSSISSAARSAASSSSATAGSAASPSSTASMGEAVGQIYVERHFPAESRRQMTELIGNLRAAFAERLRNLDWMDEPTRAAALAKLDAFEPRIGGPAVWIDYSNYRVDRGDLLGNMVRAAEFNWNLQLSRLPNPVDRRALGHERADHQRLLQSAAEPDHLPGRHPAAALLRSQCRSGGQLRRDRRGDRP